MEINKLPDTECKTMAIRMLKEMRGRMNSVTTYRKGEKTFFKHKTIKEPVRD